MKDVDQRYLYFILDHWLFSWLPENVKKLGRFGLEKNEIESVPKYYTNEAFTEVN